MSGGAAVRARNLGKRYRIVRTKDSYRTLRGDLTSHWRRRSGGSNSTQILDALRDVTFDVASGEAIGLIGRNGAGKSTLLRILARVTKPSFGSADIYGEVGALLEVGTGFHSELTGRENVFLAGSILGLTKAETHSRFDEIVAFSGLEQFIDTPVKRYSSGMYARLGFAVAAHLRPAVLIVDEVLAVGDLPFQAKCLARMTELTREGTAVLFVSHNLQAVADFCDRALLLDNGELAMDAPVQNAIREYRRRLATGEFSQGTDGDVALRTTLDGVAVNGVATIVPFSRHRLGITADGIDLPVGVDLVANVVIETIDGRVAMHLRSDTLDTPVRLKDGADEVTVELDGLQLAPADYWLWARIVSLESGHPGLWDSARVLLTIKGEAQTDGLLSPPHEFSVNSVAIGMSGNDRRGAQDD